MIGFIDLSKILIIAPIFIVYFLLSIVAGFLLRDGIKKVKII
jgi:hypothetical protein